MPRRQHRGSSSEEDDVGEAWSPRRLKKRRITKSTRLSSNLPVQNKAHSGQHGTNTVATFPDELLVEIWSHLPNVPLPTIEYVPQDAKDHVVRQQTLLALSWTCSNLRRFFCPYLWDRIEVISSKRCASN